MQFLFSAGETSTSAAVGQSVVDASEIINTLSSSGFTTLGYGSQELETEESATAETALDHLRSDLSTDKPAAVDEVTGYNAVETTLRRAVRGKLTVACPRESTDRALTVFAGPPEWLNRDAVTDGRRWLEDELQSPEIRSGDVPTPDQALLSSLVVLSGVTDVPRLEELEGLATWHRPQPQPQGSLIAAGLNARFPRSVHCGKSCCSRCMFTSALP